VALVQELENSLSLEYLATCHSLNLGIIEVCVCDDTSHGADHLLEHDEVGRVVVAQLLNDVLQQRCWIHDGITLESSASKSGQGIQPFAGKKTTLLHAASSFLSKRVDKGPSENIVAQVREIASALHDHFNEIFIRLDLTHGDIDDDTGICVGNLSQSTSHRSNVGLAETLEDVLRLRCRLFESRLDVGKSGGLPGAPLGIHVVPNLTGEQTDQIEHFIDHTRVGLGQADCRQEKAFAEVSPASLVGF
jgi:hypothetical protein